MDMKCILNSIEETPLPFYFVKINIICIVTDNCIIPLREYQIKGKIIYFCSVANHFLVNRKSSIQQESHRNVNPPNNQASTLHTMEIMSNYYYRMVDIDSFTNNASSK